MSAQRLPKVGEVWRWKIEPHDDYSRTVQRVCEWAVMTDGGSVWRMDEFLATFNPPPEEPSVVSRLFVDASEGSLDLSLRTHTHVVELFSDGTVRLKGVGK